MISGLVKDEQAVLRKFEVPSHKDEAGARKSEE